MTKVQRLFDLMAERSISAKKLSDDTGISTGNISDWKTGRSKPSLEKLAQLAKYFGVTTDYLIGKDASETDELLNTQFAAFGDARDFSEDEKDEIRNFIKFIKAKRSNKQ